jgi:hypothetical protein
MPSAIRTIITWIIIPLLLYEGIAFGLYQYDGTELPGIYTLSQRDSEFSITSIQQLDINNTAPKRFIQPGANIQFYNQILLKINYNVKRPLTLESMHVIFTYDVGGIDSFEGTSDKVNIGLSSIIFNDKDILLLISFSTVGPHSVEITGELINDQGIIQVGDRTGFQVVQ